MISPTTPASVWTEPRVERLKELWNGGDHSCGEIAADLGAGITRNAVIGKVTRLGLQSRRNNPAFYTPKPKKPRAARTIRRNGAGYVPLQPSDELDAAAYFNSLQELEAQPNPATFLGIPLQKLNDKHCRYIRTVDGQHLYCGQAKIEGSSYCAACHKRCHTHGGYKLNISEAERDRRRINFLHINGKRSVA